MRTVTIQKCEQSATQSGFDNNQGQECENLICTHPGENATCVREGAVATTQSAFAYQQKKKGGDENSKNGNTITIQKCKQAATQSGFDNNQGQECENLICTHPGENATCVQEGKAAVVVVVTPAPVKLTCEQCFTKFLNDPQISSVISSIRSLTGADITSLPELCDILFSAEISEKQFRDALGDAKVDQTIANELIACLLKAGVVFFSD